MTSNSTGVLRSYLIVKTSFPPELERLQKMRLSKALLLLLPSWTQSAYLPALKRSEQTHWSEIEVTSSTPSIGELYAFYPELATLNATGVSDHGEVLVVDSTEQAGTVTVRIAAGTLAAFCYFSIGGIGQGQFSKAWKACHENGVSDADCFPGLLAAWGAHGIVFSAGYAKGREFLLWIFNGNALQAVGLGGGANNLIERASCTSSQKVYNTKYSFTGGYGLKLGIKDALCYKADNSDIGYAQAILAMIGKKWKQLGSQGKYAKDIQFTMYDTSTRLVVGRFHVQLETANTPVCPIPIKGGDSCAAPAGY